ncbi:MAG: hypothetical protein KatS3mg028_0802 [Bacteroidia bacterium]|nr:MAG: hypothetical protein KatS3mg028_0802 [Bacteroidia bacterium]
MRDNPNLEKLRISLMPAMLLHRLFYGEGNFSFNILCSKRWSSGNDLDLIVRDVGNGINGKFFELNDAGDDKSNSQQNNNQFIV